MSPNFKGATCMMLAMASYAVNDMFIKLTATELGLFQALFIRAIFAVPFMLIIALNQKVVTMEVARQSKNWAVVMRTIGEVGATVFFLLALFNMPIANATAILQFLPLLITLAASIFFGEKVGVRRYACIIAGFIGVMLIIQPGTDGFNVHSINVLIAIAFITLRDLATKKLPNNTPSIFVALITTIAVLALGGTGAIFEQWNNVSVTNIIYLLIAAFMIISAYIFSILAMRTGDVGFTAPFRYSILIWAIIIGFTIWGEIPSVIEITGAIIVVASGLFMLHRQKKLKQVI